MEEGKTMVQWKDSCYNYVNKRKLGRVLYEKKEYLQRHNTPLSESCC